MAAGVLSAITVVALPTSLAISAATTVATGNLYMVGVPAGADAPLHADIILGHNAAGAAAAFADTQAAAATTNFSPIETGLPRSTEYDIYVTQVNGSAEASTPITETGATTGADIVNSVELEQFGSTTAKVTIDLEYGGGVLYVTMDARSQDPSLDQLIARDNDQDVAARWGTFITDPVAGENVVIAAGLVPNTAYYAHAGTISGDDDEESNVETSSAVTTAISSPSLIRPLLSGVYS